MNINTNKTPIIFSTSRTKQFLKFNFFSPLFLEIIKVSFPLLLSKSFLIFGIARLLANQYFTAHASEHFSKNALFIWYITWRV